MPYITRDESPAAAIIRLLQKRGSASIKEIEAELGVTTTAVRLQLTNLQSEGLVAARLVREGVGRPHYEYYLTDRARTLFACYCDELALLLYEELLRDQGKEKVRQLLDRVQQRLAASYAGQIQGGHVRERVNQFAQWLDNRGILADVEHLEDRVVLREYSCPYHDLAQEHREICEMEEALMSEVFKADVSLVQCMMDGHTGCHFEVRHSEPSTEA